VSDDLEIYRGILPAIDVLSAQALVGVSPYPSLDFSAATINLA